MAKNKAHCEAYRAADLKKRRDATAAKRAANPVQLKKHNPNYVKDSNLYHCYNITFKDFSDRVSEQEGKCLVCGEVPEPLKRGNPLHVDHDHDSGVVRGLLCTHCNKGLGCFRDNANALRRAADYLEGGFALRFVETA